MTIVNYLTCCLHRLRTGHCFTVVYFFAYQVCQNIGLTGHQTQSLVSKIGDQEIKDKLKETTQKALDLGVGRWGNARTIFRCLKLAIFLSIV